jgi:hypothetical protein
MGRPILGLASLLLLAAGAMPVRACINDREVTPAEREFKSQYLQPAPAPQPSPAQGEVLPVAFLGGGVVLLLGATVTALYPRKRLSPE